MKTIYDPRYIRLVQALRQAFPRITDLWLTSLSCPYECCWLKIPSHKDRAVGEQSLLARVKNVKQIFVKVL